VAVDLKRQRALALACCEAGDLCEVLVLCWVALGGCPGEHSPVGQQPPAAVAAEAVADRTRWKRGLGGAHQSALLRTTVIVRALAPEALKASGAFSWV
jgi:hypothetical protein